MCPSLMFCNRQVAVAQGVSLNLIYLFLFSILKILIIILFYQDLYILALTLELAFLVTGKYTDVTYLGNLAFGYSKSLFLYIYIDLVLFQNILKDLYCIVIF